MKRFPIGLLFLATTLLCNSDISAQSVKEPDITKQPTLYVVPYAHLDTQWNWDVQQSISEFLPKTMLVNFDYFEKYPHYVFNWTGSNRYRLMKEYFPADYERVKQYVAAGRWFPAGSSVEEEDLNLPSAESVIRQVLYANMYFRKEFGKTSTEVLLPDTFGYPASIPSILAHCGIRGFSTQKLIPFESGAPVGGPGSIEETLSGIPFNVGLWEGTDGKTVIAALSPGRYAGKIEYDLSKSRLPVVTTGVDPNDPEAGLSAERKKIADSTDWVKRIELDGKVSGIYADYHYVGTGDIGGAADESSVKLLEAMVTHGKAVLPGGMGPDASVAQVVGDGPVQVLSATAERMFNDITPEMTARLPRYKGDMELINHSAGSLTSEAYLKRWNRKNEILADAAEKASVAAMWLGGPAYPQQRLNDAWTLVLANQFHDTAAGTASPRAYEFAQNDEVIALNQFAGVLTSATQSLASGLDTRTTGTAVVVYNSLNIRRQDIVEAAISFPAGRPRAIRVVGPDGSETPSQWSEDGNVLFLADVPSVGYSVYDVQPADGSGLVSNLKVTQSSLENARYRVALDDQGDVSSIFDKVVGKELLSGPVRLAISKDAPHMWPAWNMDFDQEQAAPQAYVSAPARVRILESGPARVALQVTRTSQGSSFTQTVRLSAGSAGDRVEFADDVDWRSLAANLKAVFPLTAANESATYNWEVGNIERPTANAHQFEVASHHWIDLTDAGGAYGATILTDVKNGSDKPDDRTIRLTLMRSPGLPDASKRPVPPAAHSDQQNQDWGHHEIVYGIAGHAGSFGDAQTDWQAYRLSTPLVSFASAKHSGALGKEVSLLTIDAARVRVLALKKAELSDEVILRIVNLDGRPLPHVSVKFSLPVSAAREVNGQEVPLGPASLMHNALTTSLAPYQLRTFALTWNAPPTPLSRNTSQPVPLQYERAVASADGSRTSAGFDGHGNSLPAEMLPSTLTFHDVAFHLAPGGVDKPNAIDAHGQTIALPKGDFNKIYILAAATDGDQQAAFRIGNMAKTVTIENWGGFIGEWDTRVWKARPATTNVGGKEVPLRRDWAVSANPTWDLHYAGAPYWKPKYPEDYLSLRPGFIKRADIAWFASHHHNADGLNEPYEYSYLFAYGFDLPSGATTLTLPMNDKVRILAISVAHQAPNVEPAQPLYDTLEVNHAIQK